MILKALTLVNYRRYENLRILFKDGITGIVGRNGSGKSTLLEAILWCLYGNRAARTSKDEIKRQTASDSDTCAVSLEFELRGVAYELTRSLIGKTNRTETKLTQQGRLDAVTTREVDNYVVKLLGLDIKGFLSSFFARQKELNALSDARPAERKNHLAKMLGVGRLDHAIEALKVEIKSVRQKIDILQSLQANPEELEDAIAAKTAEIEAIQKQIKQFQSDKAEVQEQMTGLSTQIKNLRQKQDTYTKLEKALAELKALQSEKGEYKNSLSNELQDIERALSRIPELNDKILDINDLEKIQQGLITARAQIEEKKQIERDVENSKKLYSKYLTEQKRLDQEIELLNQKILGKDGFRADLESKKQLREDLREKYKIQDRQAAALQDNITKLKKQKKQIATLGPDASCESCLRPFGDDFSSIEAHFDQELVSFQKREESVLQVLKDLKKEGEAISGGIAGLEQTLDEIVGTEKRLATAAAQYENIVKNIQENELRASSGEKRLAELETVKYSEERLKTISDQLIEKRKAKEELVRLQERVSRKEKIKADFDKISAELADAEKAIAKIESEKGALQFDVAKFEAVEENLTTARKAESEISLALERSSGSINVINKEIEQFRRQVEDYQKSLVEVAGLRRTLQYQEKLSLLFTEFRVFLIGRIRPTLSRQTSRLFHDMTSGRYQEVELDDDYNLCLFDGGEKFPIDRFSGGEIDLANLCFRLAISIEMASTAGIENSFVILDEIFGSQDSERQQLIVEGLSRLKNRFRQIIIVSHIDDVKELSENIIAVEIADSGVSRVSFMEN